MFNEKRRTVSITDDGFDPTGIPATLGHPFLVELVNRSQHAHMIEFDLPSGPVRLVEPLPPGRRTFINLVSDDLGVFPFRSMDDDAFNGTLVINAVM